MSGAACDVQNCYWNHTGFCSKKVLILKNGMCATVWKDGQPQPPERWVNPVFSDDIVEPVENIPEETSTTVEQETPIEQPDSMEETPIEQREQTESEVESEIETESETKIESETESDIDVEQELNEDDFADTESEVEN